MTKVERLAELARRAVAGDKLEEGGEGSEEGKQTKIKKETIERKRKKPAARKAEKGTKKGKQGVKKRTRKGKSCLGVEYSDDESDGEAKLPTKPKQKPDTTIEVGTDSSSKKNIHKKNTHKKETVEESDSSSSEESSSEESSSNETVKYDENEGGKWEMEKISAKRTVLNDSTPHLEYRIHWVGGGDSEWVREDQIVRTVENYLITAFEDGEAARRKREEQRKIPGSAPTAARQKPEQARMDEYERLTKGLTKKQVESRYSVLWEQAGENVCQSLGRRTPKYYTVPSLVIPN